MRRDENKSDEAKEAKEAKPPKKQEPCGEVCAKKEFSVSTKRDCSKIIGAFLSHPSKSKKSKKTKERPYSVLVAWPNPKLDRLFFVVAAVVLCSI